MQQAKQYFDDLLNRTSAAEREVSAAKARLGQTVQAHDKIVDRAPVEARSYFDKMLGGAQPKINSSAAPVGAGAVDRTAGRTAPSTSRGVSIGKTARVRPEMAQGGEFKIPSGGFAQTAPQRMSQLAVQEKPFVPKPVTGMTLDDLTLTGSAAQPNVPQVNPSRARTQFTGATARERARVGAEKSSEEQVSYLRALPQEKRRAAAKAIVARGEQLSDEARELAGFDVLERSITTIAAPLMSGMGRVVSGVGKLAEEVAPVMGYGDDYKSGLSTIGANLQETGKNVGQIGYQGPAARFVQGAVATVPLLPAGLSAFVVDSYLESRGAGEDNATALKHAATTAAGVYAGGKLSRAFEGQVEGTIKQYLARSGGLATGLAGASAVAGDEQTLESLGHTIGMSLGFGVKSHRSQAVKGTNKAIVVDTLPASKGALESDGIGVTETPEGFVLFDPKHLPRRDVRAGNFEVLPETVAEAPVIQQAPPAEPSPPIRPRYAPIDVDIRAGEPLATIPQQVDSRAGEVIPPTLTEREGQLEAAERGRRFVERDNAERRRAVTPVDVERRRNERRVMEYPADPATAEVQASRNIRDVIPPLKAPAPEAELTATAAFRLPSGEVVTGAAHGDIQASDARVFEKGTKSGVVIDGDFVSIEQLDTARGDYTEALRLARTARSPTEVPKVEAGGKEQPARGEGKELRPEDALSDDDIVTVYHSSSSIYDPNRSGGPTLAESHIHPSEAARWEKYQREEVEPFGYTPSAMWTAAEPTPGYGSIVHKIRIRRGDIFKERAAAEWVIPEDKFASAETEHFFDPTRGEKNTNRLPLLEGATFVPPERDAPEPRKATKGGTTTPPLWKQTQSEFIEHSDVGYQLARQEHKAGIVKALSEGKPVPAEVLADYPDLKPPTETKPAPQADAQASRNIRDAIPPLKASAPKVPKVETGEKESAAFKHEDAIFRVQDQRYPLPDASTNWRNTVDEPGEMKGVSGFIDLHSASDDLLGSKSRDDWGGVYSDAIKESGGEPVLSLYKGQIVGDDIGNGVVSNPVRKTELRISQDGLWDGWLSALTKEFPEDAGTLSKWPRTAEGWEALGKEYELTDFQQEAFDQLKGNKFTGSEPKPAPKADVQAKPAEPENNYARIAAQPRAEFVEAFVKKTVPFQPKTAEGKRGIERQRVIARGQANSIYDRATKFAEGEAKPAEPVKAAPPLPKRAGQATAASKIDTPIQQALTDWNEGRAYIDNNGNYRVKGPKENGQAGLKSNGRIAPWNKEVKRAFPDVQAFHQAAQEAKTVERDAAKVAWQKTVDEQYAPTWGTTAEAETSLGRNVAEPDTTPRFKPGEAKKVARMSDAELEAYNAKQRAALVTKETAEPQFAKNKVFTQDRVEAARERMKVRKNERGSGGPSTEELADAAIIAGAHVESGVRSMVEFSKRMVDEFGEWVRPHLAKLYDDASKQFVSERPEWATGIKNAVVAEERIARGLDPIQTEFHKSFPESRSEGVAMVDQHPDFAAKVEEWSKTPKPLTDAEDAAMVYHRTKLHNAHKAAMEEIIEAQKKGDIPAEAAATDRRDAVEEQMQIADLAAKRTGTEWGRGGSARRMMMKEDYSLATLVQKGRAANEGKPLDAEQRAKFEEVSKALEDKIKEFDDYREAASKREMEAATRKLEREATRQGRRAKKSTDLDAEFTALLAQLRSGEGISGGPEAGAAIVDVELLQIIGKLARNRVEKGIVKAEELVDTIYEAVKDRIPGVEHRDVRDAISGHGQPPKQTRTEAQSDLTRIKRELRESSVEIDRLKRTAEKEQARQEQKRERRAVGESDRAKKGIQARDKKAAKEQASIAKGVDSIHRGFQLRGEREARAEGRLPQLEAQQKRMEKRKASLEKQLETGNFTTASRTRVPLDPGAQKIQVEIDALKKQADEQIKTITTERLRKGFDPKELDRDMRWYDYVRSPTSNLNFRGTYERVGGVHGYQASEIIRNAQVDIATGDVSRQEAINRARKDIIPIQKALRAAGKHGLSRMMTEHIEAVRDPDAAFRGLAGFLKSFQYNTKLRFNPRSTLINELQTLQTLWPHLTTAEFLKIAADARRPSIRKRIVELADRESGGKVEVKEGKRRFDMFGKASETNRVMGHLAGELMGKRMGLEGRELERYAADWNKKVEFDNSRWDIPPLFRGNLASVLLQFKPFMVKNIERLHADWKRAPEGTSSGTLARRAKMITAQLAIGGVRSALPGVKSIAGVLMLGALAKSFQKAGLDEDDANKVAELFYFGAPGFMEQDLSSSVMILDEPFGNTPSEKMLNFLGGPTLGLIHAAWKEGGRMAAAKDSSESTAAEKREASALRMGKAITPLVKTGQAIYAATKGETPTMRLGAKKEPMTTGEAIGYGLQGTPKRQTLFYDNAEAYDWQRKLAEAYGLPYPKAKAEKGSSGVPDPAKKIERKIQRMMKPGVKP